MPELELESDGFNAKAKVEAEADVETNVSTSGVVNAVNKAKQEVVAKSEKTAGVVREKLTQVKTVVAGALSDEQKTALLDLGKTVFVAAADAAVITFSQKITTVNFGAANGLIQFAIAQAIPVLRNLLHEGKVSDEQKEKVKVFFHEGPAV